MYPCGNCGAEFNGRHDDCLVIEQGGAPVASLCSSCVGGTKIIKIILKRDDKGVFACEQYAALEMINKAFGK